MQYAAATPPDPSDPRLRKALRRSNLPLPQRAGRSWPERVLKSPLLWIALVLLALEIAGLIDMYNMSVHDVQSPRGGTKLGIGTEAFRPAVKAALLTVIPLSLLFIWVDRFRPQRLWVWLITFGWGAGIATWISMLVNTWAAGQLVVEGDGDPAAAARPAIFIAPFVEEASKATVLFLLAILMRYRWVSRLSGIALAGLSAAAFAFTENILYYGRIYRAAAQTSGAGEPEQVMHELFLQRGVYTCFGHPLFTMMTGIGLAIALRARSKTVRVLAPVTGFLVAVALHMMFNGTVSTSNDETQLKLMYFFMALPLVAGMVLMTILQVFKEKRLIWARLRDYVQMGWLDPDDPHYLSRPSSRLHAQWQALWEWRIANTLRIQRAAIELAYLRDAMTRGLVDDAGMVREKQLLLAIGKLRASAIVEPRRRTRYPRRLAFWRRDRSVSDHPATGIINVSGATSRVNMPAPIPAAVPGSPLGSSATQYSEVDPTWRPPGQ